MKKTLLLLVMVVIVSSFAYALDWHEQKIIAKKIGNRLDYEGGLRFAYYEEFDNNYAYYNNLGFKVKNSLITFYKPSCDLSSYQFGCLVLHELGHYDDVKVKYTKINKGGFTDLSEDYADEYMLKVNPLCEDWENTKYEGFEEFKINERAMAL